MPMSLQANSNVRPKAKGSDSPPDCHSLPRTSNPPTSSHKQTKKHPVGCFFCLVDLVGFEPMTSALRTRRSPS